MDQVFPQLLAVLLLLVSAACANTLYFQPETELVCPDNKHTCNSDTTCCPLPNGQYGCCMYANAVCCSDNIHCCPTGSYCDVNTGSCDKNGVKFEWSKKAPAALYIPKQKVKSQQPWVERIPPPMEFQQPESIPWAKKLPGLKVNSLNISSLHSPASCSVSQTLCKSDSGLSGCCPFPNAVCCDKGQQCCPSGFQCNLKFSKCEKPTEETIKKMTSLLPGRTLFALRESVVCPNVVTVCPKDTTCCLIEKDSYGCCPYISATCCSDHEHCCPNGYTCDVTDGQCVKKQVDKILVKLTKWRARQTCPDMETTCTEGATCCPLTGGTYGCCPYPKAVCCSDNYCCPRGYTCDVRHSKCQLISQGLTCPDHQTQCSSGMTCCHIEEHVYGCCPFPQATCCTDDEHCCPEGYTCDLKDSQCVSGSQIQSAAIECLDKKTKCPYSTTCCILPDGTYGCCPYTKATCCADHIHCCPNGYTCDTEDAKCLKNGIGSTELSIPLLAIQSTASVICPDNSQCTPGTTCCLTESGYKCCPFPEARCCSDMKHCCPGNFICDPIRGRCRIEAPAKQVSLTSLSVANVTFSCPDSQCPSGSTCCPISSTRFGCCPLPKAVCCNDRKHCCPKSYHCDLEHSRCVLGQTSLPLFKKFLPSKSLTAMKLTKKLINSVMCPDYSECPDRNTCCLMDTGAWGCCPYLKATCCADDIHCCPNGFTCDTKHAKCVKNGIGSTELSIPLSAIHSTASVKCPDNSQCTTGTTCCLAESGYKCCPFPEAVCCIDRKHCCPRTYFCDMKQSKCVSFESSINPIFSMVYSQIKPAKKSLP